MSSRSRAWMVAASIGVVEALKDQGLCRWNYAFRSLHQNLKNNVKSFSHQHPKMLSSALMSKKVEDERLKKSEESLRTVMYLSCWGPN